MRLILEMTDLLEILSAHLGRVVTPEQVAVRMDPVFELEVQGAVGVSDVRPGASERVRSVRADDVVAGAVVTGVSRGVAPPDNGMGFGELLEYSREIETGIKNLTRR